MPWAFFKIFSKLSMTPLFSKITHFGAFDADYFEDDPLQELNPPQTVNDTPLKTIKFGVQKICSSHSVIIDMPKIDGSIQNGNG